MYDEYNALVKNDTWVLVPRPADVNMVRSIWLFKHKFHADGTLSRYKARLVANDSSQQLGVDFDETFSPVVKLATIRMIFSLPVSRKRPIHSWMLTMHFLTRFAGYATRTRFSHSRSESSLFIYTHGSQVAYLLIYVDDIILTTSSTALLQQIIDSLRKEFDMTDLGVLNYFLGIFATRHSTGLFLSQKKYALQNSERAHMVACNPSWTPVDIEAKLGPDGVPVQDLTLYRSLSGGYTDADWAGCPSSRRLNSGYCVFLGDNLLSWPSKSVVYMSTNPVQHQRAKHIEIDIHFVRDMVTAGDVRVLHVPSRFQYADIFIKGLPSALFEEFRSSLSVHPPSAQTAKTY
uniref:Ribonuclease H-like domain-containing protein n=1 Tax=Tanacetum cinerariifolium TaxID=118510 RepID=A0A699GJZ4_TANCI|nr:ribonuclease H-like domain-containing protein [Tanacetum cinerariifolium]